MHRVYHTHHLSIIWADNSSSYFKMLCWIPLLLPPLQFSSVFPFLLFIFHLQWENKIKRMTNPSNTYRIQHHLHAECSALSVVKQIKSRNKLEKCKKKVYGMKKIRKCLPKKPETRIYTWPTNMAVVDFLQSALFWSFVENVATDSGTRSCPLSFSQGVDLLPQSSVRNWVLGSTEPVDRLQWVNQQLVLLLIKAS